MSKAQRQHRIAKLLEQHVKTAAQQIIAVVQTIMAR